MSVSTTKLLAPLVLSIALTTSAASAQSRETCAIAAEDAQTFRQKQQLLETKEKLLICAQRSCPSFIATDCAHWLDEVDHEIPSLAIKVTDAQGADVVNAQILVDGNFASQRADGKSLQVNPGSHMIRVTQSGTGLTKEVEVVTPARDHVIKLVQLPAPAPPPSIMVMPPPEPPHHSIPAGTFIAGGVAIAALGTFTVLEIIAQGDVSDLRDGCGQTKSCSHDDISAAHTKLEVAAVLLGVGVVAAATGAVLYFMNPSDAKTAYFRNGKFYF